MGCQDLQFGSRGAKKLSGTMFTISILVLLAVASANAICISKSGKTCKPASEMPSIYGRIFFKGKDPCFAWQGKNKCFVDSARGSGNYMTTCNPNQCGCGGVCNEGDDGGPPKCDKADERTECDKTEAYCNISPEHTMCKYCGTNIEQCGQVCARGITNQADKDAIVDKHNQLRRRVAKGLETKGLNGQGQPPATDMYELKWNDELAEIAQRWADQCTFEHSKEDGTSEYSFVGQNVAFGADMKLPSYPGYATFIQNWYDEVSDWPAANVASFSLDGVPEGKMVGHYTQAVWGATKEVGCGYVSFNNTEHAMSFDGKYPYMRIMVCDYGPGGNYEGMPLYTAGPTGTDCKKDSNYGLCTW